MSPDATGKVKRKRNSGEFRYEEADFAGLE
jgi:hypothetical protein